MRPVRAYGILRPFADLEPPLVMELSAARALALEQHADDLRPGDEAQWAPSVRVRTVSDAEIERLREQDVRDLAPVVGHRQAGENLAFSPLHLPADVLENDLGEARVRVERLRITLHPLRSRRVAYTLTPHRLPALAPALARTPHDLLAAVRRLEALGDHDSLRLLLAHAPSTAPNHFYQRSLATFFDGGLPRPVLAVLLASSDPIVREQAVLQVGRTGRSL